MTEEQPKFLAVLPWLPRIRDKIEIGPFVFWQWPWNEKEYVPSDHTDRVKETLNTHFRYVQRNFAKEDWIIAPCTSLCMVSRRDKALGESLWFTKEDFELFKPAVDILCASSLFKTLLRRDSINAENPSVQELFYKNATDFTWFRIPLGAEAASKQIRRRYGGVLRGEFPPIPRVQPDECTEQEVIEKDSLVTSLGKMLESPPSDFSRRIFRAIEQFISAFTDSMVITHRTEIVMLGTALEILLDLSDVFGREKKDRLTEIFTQWFAGNESIIKEPEGISWKVYWIRQFYYVRNKIVHGNEVELRDLEWRANPYAGLYGEIAIHVFRLALMKTLVKNHLQIETDEDIWQANKLDEWLSTEMKRFPSASDLDYALWVATKDLKT